MGLFYGNQKPCPNCGTYIRLDGDWEMPAWRVIALMLPCTILTYFIVRPLDVTWVSRSLVGILVAFALMQLAVYLSAKKWPLTTRPPHAPEQYEVFVPEDAGPPPQHLSI